MMKRATGRGYFITLEQIMSVTKMMACLFLAFGCVSENVPKVLKIFKDCLKDIATNGFRTR